MNWHASLLIGFVMSISATVQSSELNDPYLWLEEVDGPNALAWVRGMNEVTRNAIHEQAGYETLRDRLQSILESDERLVFPSVHGDMLYDFRQDADHIRGIWRRCSWDDFRAQNDKWETVLDLDALAEIEDESWVWKGVSVLKPSADRALIRLSRGGGDAVVIREFDLNKKIFITDGFNLPEAKSRISWVDQDTVLVQTDTGPDSLTSSGYPRTVRQWQRGTTLSESKLMFTAPVDHVSAWGWAWRGQGHQLTCFGSSPDFFTSQLYCEVNGENDENGELVAIDKPDSASLYLFADQLLLELREPWTIAEHSWPAGSLLAFNRSDYLAGKRQATILFTPSERESLADITTTRSQLVLQVLHNVVSELHIWNYDNNKWSLEPVSDANAKQVNSLYTRGVDNETSDEWLMIEHGYLQPHRLILAGPQNKREELRSSPSFFNTDGLEVTRGEAISEDGTAIPWTRVAKKTIKNNDIAEPQSQSQSQSQLQPPPTILYGYGGFEISLKPGYNSILGAAWLEQGGAYVVAHIRGGGEFGPRWHRAALKHNRQRSFDDFIAVGEHLIAEGLANPNALAIQGGSNGGALVGAVYTQRPDLWTAAVCQVPLLDFMRYHLLPPGASWIGEYGDPELPEDRAVLEQWSPYQNLKADVSYPPILLTTSTRDDRVHPGHARKFAARLKELGAPVDYLEKIEGGHGGAANRRARAELEAMVYTWLSKQLGLTSDGALK